MGDVTKFIFVGISSVESASVEMMRSPFISMFYICAVLWLICATLPFYMSSCFSQSLFPSRTLVLYCAR